MADPPDTADEPPRKGRSNAILTYETVEAIQLGIQRVDLKVSHLGEKLDDVGRAHIDHEVRIRALELTAARSSGSTSLAQWATPVLLSIGMAVLAVLNYIK